MKKLLNTLKQIKKKCSSPEDPNLAKIKRQIKDLSHFVKKLSRAKKIDQQNLSTHLLIGPSQCGKTTLLVNSDLKFVLEKKIAAYNAVPSTQNFDWWLTKQKLFIDTPHDYFDTYRNKDQLSRASFLKYLKKYLPNQKIQSVMFVLSVKDIIQPNKRSLKKLYKNIQKHLFEIEKILNPNIPAVLIINQCDQITGFREFFDDLSQDERWQIWGLPLKKHTLIKDFNANFNKLIHRLNDQMIWHLHHEVNTKKHALINDFPAQMAHLKTHLETLLKHTFNLKRSSISLKGIFFTSATQRDLTFDYLDADHISTKTQLIQISKENHRGYFIQKLFQDFLSLSELQPKKNYLQKKFTKDFICYLIAGFIIIFGISSLGLIIRDQLTQLNQTQKLVSTYQAMINKTKEPSLKTKLNILNILQRANRSLKENRLIIDLLPAYHETQEKLQQKISSLFQQASHTTLAPLIIKSLANTLIKTNISPDLLYSTLKSYLMLGLSDHLDIAYITNTLQTIWQPQYSSQQLTELMKLSVNTLSQNTFDVHLNPGLIAQARKRLHQLKPDDLAYTILLNQVKNSQMLALNLNQNLSASSIFTFAKDNFNIPNIYTSQNSLINKPMPFFKAAQEALNGNWVIGQEKNYTQDKNKLAKTIYQQYINNYADTWSSFLNNIRMINFTDLASLDKALQLLAGDNSPLNQLIQLTKNNLNPAIAKRDTELNTFIHLNNQKTVQTVQQLLLNLHQYIESIYTADEPDKTAFKLASIRMRNNGQGKDPIEKALTAAAQYPEPIKSWLYDISINAWQLILFQSQNYIDNIWMNKIFPQYLSQISGRFPFNQNATQEVSLDNFSYVFSPNGLLDHFVTHTLKAFVNTDTAPWKLKTLDGSGLQISEASLKDLEQAMQIKNIYFPGHDEHLIIPFKIQPNTFDDNIAQLTIKLGSQQFNFKNGEKPSKETLVWPDYSNSKNVSVSLISKDNQHLEITKQGIWAWLKLLQENHMQPTKTPEQYSVTFNKDGYSAKATLFMKQPKNPFSLKWFAGFSLPNEL